MLAGFGRAAAEVGAHRGGNIDKRGWSAIAAEEGRLHSLALGMVLLTMFFKARVHLKEKGYSRYFTHSQTLFHSS